MLFYNFNELNKFIKNNLIYDLTQEQKNIQKIIDLYKNKKTYFSEFITNMIDISDSVEKNKLDTFHNIISSLKKSFEEISEIENLSIKLNNNINETISLYNENLENNENEIKANLVEYNKQRDELFNKILEFENSNNIQLNSIIDLFFKKSNKKAKHTEIYQNADDINKVKIDIEPHDYNTLIISEKEQKAYLPFFYSDIKKIYENTNNKYATMQDVIDNLYILPLDNFSNSSISRFRESFNLIRNKEKGSILKALDLSLELMFKYELNPIIIAACRNLDELDIYLDCLDSDKLQDFKCFDIKFEVMPKIVKNIKY